MGTLAIPPPGVLLMNEPIFWHISARALYGWAGADLRAHIASQGDNMHISQKKRVDRHDGSSCRPAFAPERTSAFILKPNFPKICGAERFKSARVKSCHRPPKIKKRRVREVLGYSDIKDI